MSAEQFPRYSVAFSEVHRNYIVWDNDCRRPRFDSHIPAVCRNWAAIFNNNQPYLRRNEMRTGTNCFASKEAAIIYYASQEGVSRSRAVGAVSEKIGEGLISIGPPKFDERTQRLSIDPVEQRYFIEEVR